MDLDIDGLDELDLQILEILIKDSRTPFFRNS